MSWLSTPDFSRREERYENGKVNLYIRRDDGLEECWRFYRNDLVESQCFLRNGKMEGVYKEWYANGRLGRHEFYQDGKEEGEGRYWYGDGGIRELVFFRSGKMEGKYKYWDPRGHLREQEFYLAGKLIDKKFDHPKEQVFLQIIQSFRTRAIEPLKVMLISDLMKMF